MKNEIITFTSPKSSVSEVFRTLRTNIQFMNVNNKLKSVLVTSTVPGEGKSWVAANLAITFAQAGKKVVLVDADMRRGRQHKLFEVKNDKGLSNYLILSVDDSINNLADYIQETLIDNLYIMTAGIVPPNPSELLTSQKMSDLIRELESLADIVIFDGTPSTIVTDAIILSRFVGSTVIVASHKNTKIEQLKQVKRNIENVGGKIAGVVVNKIPTEQKSYSGGYYYENAVAIESKKRWFEKIFKPSYKPVQDSEIDQVKQKLDEVEPIKEEQEEIKIAKNPIKKRKQENERVENKEEDIDINLVLKQLTQYLAEEKNKN